jgi:hypothetical protein
LTVIASRSELNADKFMLNKIKLMVQLLSKKPIEFWDRAFMAVEQRVETGQLAPDTISANILWNLPPPLEDCLSGFLAEDGLSGMEAHITQMLERLAPSAPFSMAHSADFRLAKFCYAACRAIKPQTVVETGVAYGVTTCLILKALQANENGELWSIDLSPLTEHSQEYQGILVPPSLRARWHLCRGASRRILPKLLNELPNGVDVFVHDSLHTYRNMTREFRTIWPVVKGMLISDDIDLNKAFFDFVSTAKPPISFAVKEESKDSVFGVALKSEHIVMKCEEPGRKLLLG